MSFVKLLITARTMYGVTFSKAQAAKILKGRYQEMVEWIRGALWPTDPKKKALAGMYRKMLHKNKMVLNDVLHELAVCVVIASTYRKRYPAVPELWKQYGETARAVVQDGEERIAGKVTWYMDGDDLCSRLPSGRVRYYNCLLYTSPSPRD